MLYDIDHCVLVSLLVEILLGKYLGAVDHVRRDLTTFHDTQFRFHVLALGFLDTVVVDGADTGTHAQVDAEVDLGADDRVGGDAHLREKTITPVALDGLGNL